MVRKPRPEDPFALPEGSFIIVDTTYPNHRFAIGIDPLDEVADNPDLEKELEDQFRVLFEHAEAVDEAVPETQGVVDPEEGTGRD
jgi:hypothetical protein